MASSVESFGTSYGTLYFSSEGLPMVYTQEKRTTLHLDSALNTLALFGALARYLHDSGKSFLEESQEIQGPDLDHPKNLYVPAIAYWHIQYPLPEKVRGIVTLDSIAQGGVGRDQLAVQDGDSLLFLTYNSLRLEVPASVGDEPWCSFAPSIRLDPPSATRLLGIIYDRMPTRAERGRTLVCKPVCDMITTRIRTLLL